MIRHIVALKFNPDTTESTKRSIFADLAALTPLIDGILDFQMRENVSPEDPVVHGFRDLFWFDFRDAKVRDAYLVHPQHQAVGARIVSATEGGPEGVLVLDFEV
ncbi:Stress responsive alpha-beta barrel domain protein Dabb [Candidatus Rhodobacter oscarellae]|uniref:Stress responsive alpha-beta barrel domain protein Dabb n=1 Tax=Candidatus Rhodobacter oscarellae TaxID=1675527 RepID=A0A0J9EB25_9RHOB|nr:Dabb family protein [Candidatus Rhodobacter lobularis]KMW59985.1 Stress responsive alpha-beta barrel domain protein Dabb [Candidatus Rhodobacter lobularis]